MIRLAAILSLLLALIFYVWDISRGHWTFTLFVILGLLFWCISDTTDWRP